MGEYLILGDLANCVHIQKKKDDKYEIENVIGVNDSVLYVALQNEDLIITTRQGIYVFEIKQS